jgi:tRNA 5-methylaminomethyl-2-thiouridine biosynthesis bifunctional protein
VPLADGDAWLTGSTYGRDDEDTAPRIEEHLANLARLRELLPAAAETMEREMSEGRLNAWTGIRCASTDRRPLVGELEPGLWVSTAMGSRGLSFAMLCAELIAARLHGEPLPLARRLAALLEVGRQRA